MITIIEGDRAFNTVPYGDGRDLPNRYSTDKERLNKDVNDAMKALKKWSLDKVMTEFGYAQHLNSSEMNTLRYAILNRINRGDK